MGSKVNRKKGGRGQAAYPPRQGRAVLVLTACLIPVLLVGFSLYAKDLTMSAWNAVAKYQSPYLAEIPPVTPTGTAATGGVLLIIVDGLRLDASREVCATFNEMRAKGADFTAVAGQPSLSDPAAAVIPSGTVQEIHGVTTNWYEGLLAVDHLFHSARRSGRSTAVVAGKGWIDLYGEAIDDMHCFDDSADDYDSQVFAQAMAILTGEAPLPDLMIVHFGGVDHYGHSHGGASQDYRNVAQRIDGYIAEMLAAYDLDKRTVILTSDHGHIDTGGHGGWEPEVLNVPLVLAGKAVKVGAQGAANQWDIAPTICALLGMSMPTHTVGTILDDALTLPPDTLARAFIDLARTRHTFTREYVAAVAGALPASQAMAQAAAKVTGGADLADQAWVNLVGGDPELAVSAAKQALGLLDQGRDEVRSLRLAAERASRRGPALLFVLLPLVPLVLLARNRWFSLAAGGAVLYFVFYNVVFFVVHGFRFSLSIFNEEGLIKQFFNDRMLEAALTVLVVAAIVGLIAGRRRSYDGPELAQAAAAMSYLVTYVLSLQVVFFYYLYGVSFDWFLPDLLLGFKFYLDLLQVVPTGFASVLVVPLVLAFAKLSSALAGRRQAAPPA